MVHVPEPEGNSTGIITGSFVMSELLQTVRAWQQLQKPQIHSVTMHISLRISIGMPLPLVDNGKAAPTCVRVKLAGSATRTQGDGNR
mmetsp:Transcript_8633/g.23323  ORF Transcript_8633/g.23323 Transcript_8633/m.23323 type:complete len:87 (+) Transcript_8633:494-754(+)